MNTLTTKPINSINPSNTTFLIKQAYDAVYQLSELSPIQGVSSEDDTCGETEFEHGGTAIFLKANDSLHVDDMDSFENTFDLKYHIDTDSEHIKGEVVEFTTMIRGLDVPNKAFSCIYDLENPKGIPQSIYKALDYLIENSEMSHGAILELFAAATCSLACHCFGNRIETAKNICYRFDIKAALEHDLLISKNQ